MKPEPSIRAASVLSYVIGLLTLLSIGPSLAYNLYSGSSFGSLFGPDPSYGDFLGSNPIGRLWGFTGALVFSLAFLTVSALDVVAGYWLGRSLKKGGRLGAIATPFIMAFGIGFVLPLWILVPPIILVLLVMGWKTLR